MKTWEEKGGSAYPSGAQQSYHGEPGMTLRDWFAGQALAMCNNDKAEYIAEWVYKIADAMLKEREK